MLVFILLLLLLLLIREIVLVVLDVKTSFATFSAGKGRLTARRIRVLI